MTQLNSLAARKLVLTKIAKQLTGRNWTRFSERERLGWRKRADRLLRDKERWLSERTS